MKATIKRTLCRILVLCIVINMLPLAVTASTGGKTSADAVAWAQNHANNASVLDYDSAYGAQCVDLIKYYYVYLGNSAVLGNGKDYATNSVPGGWSRIQYYSGFVPQPGDVAVWTTGGGGYGHVAIVISANASTMTVVEQNYAGKYCSKRTNASTSGIWGVIRPDFSGGDSWYASRTPANLGTNFTALILNLNAWKPIENSYSEGEKPPVRIANETGNANQLWFFVRQSDGSYTISSCYDGKNLDVRDASTAVGTIVQTCESNGNDAQKWFIYEESGGYVLRSKLSDQVLDLNNNDATAGNYLHTYTYNQTGAQIWAIYTGQECVMQSPTLSVTAAASSIAASQFTWNDVYGEKEYCLRIWEGAVGNGDPCQTFWKAESGIRVKLPAGTYQATVDAVHYHDRRASNTVTFTVAEHKHSYSTTVTAPTCTAQGYTTHKCSACGDSYVDSYTNALGHGYTYRVSTAPSVTETGKLTGACSRCSATTSVTLPKLNRSDYLYSVISEATCTSDGSASYVLKDLSYGSHVFEVTVPRTAHSYIGLTIPPACEEQGFTTYTCSVCGDKYTDSYVDASGHSYGEWEIVQAPACIKQGEKVRTCVHCGAEETEPVPAIEHDYRASTVEPTCTEDGHTVYTCANCADEYVDNIVESAGHNFSEWVVVSDAACGTAGSEQRQCCNCFESEAREIPALEHDYDSVITAPTCEMKGYSTHTCAACGDSYVDGYMDALGHSFENGICVVCGASQFLWGDANSDGKVDNIDAMMILQYTVGLETAIELNFAACDVSDDGQIDNVDAMQILQYTVGLISGFAADR